MAKTPVFIVGGGVAGLSAAHELAKHPGLFDVHVYEQEPNFGGKCASQDVVIKGKSGPYLGEHGFRFFPWFYRHLSETLDDIPIPGGAKHTLDELKESQEMGMALKGAVYPVPRGTRNMAHVNFPKLIELAYGALGATTAELLTLAWHYLMFHTSCFERREKQYEYWSWAKFLGMEPPKQYSDHFIELLESVPMMLVAMQASKGSARTLGNIGIQMLYDFDTKHYDKIDAVLQGPTSMTWIEPWVADLRTKGVDFSHTGYELLRIELDPSLALPRKAKTLVFKNHTTGLDEKVDVTGGYCICALPINRVGAILSADLKTEPALANLDKLINFAPPPWGNMIGVQYYLDADDATLDGHAAYPGSDWALTSVSQAHYWRGGGFVDPDKEFGLSGSGVKGLVSVIACNWDNPVNDSASPVDKHAARDCTEDEVKDEIWRQLVKGAYAKPTDAPNRIGSHLDKNVSLKPFDNPTPLLVHPPGSYPLRPKASLPNIANLMLASDYVATHTELATMEGANEAAKRAVRAIFKKEGVPNSLSNPWPGIHKLAWDKFFEAARKADCELFKWGLPAFMVDLSSTVQLLATFDEIPPDVGTFVFDAEAQTTVRVPARSAQGTANLRQFTYWILDRSTNVVYGGFPEPGHPAVSGEDLAPMYQQFWKHRTALRRFRDEPTEAGYRLWEEVLAGDQLVDR